MEFNGYVDAGESAVHISCTLRFIVGIGLAAKSGFSDKNVAFVSFDRWLTGAQTLPVSIRYACLLVGAFAAGARWAAAAESNLWTEREPASSILEWRFDDSFLGSGGARYFPDLGASPACEIATGAEAVEMPFRPFAAEEVGSVTPLPPVVPQAVQPPLENPTSTGQFLQRAQPQSGESEASVRSRLGALAAGQPCGGWFGGAEITCLRPFAGDLTELGLSVPILNVGLLSSRPSNQISVSPRIWLGYTSAEGTGARVRYWQFDHALLGEADEIFLNGNLPLGSRRVSEGRLNIYTVDLEASQKLLLQTFAIEGRLGMCVAGLEHDRSLTYVIPSRPDTTLGFLRSFTGIGPSTGADCLRRLGNSHMTFVFSGRGAILFGQRTQSLYVSNELNMDGLTQPALNFHVRTENVLYASEIRMGMQYEKTLKSGRRIFGRLMWENQFWAGSGAGLAGVGLTGVAVGLGTAR